MRAVLDWFFNRFRADNNFRADTFLLITGGLLVFNLLVFGFGPAIMFGRSEEAQRYYNAYFQGQYVTDAELMTWYQRFLGGIGAGFGWAGGWMRWSAWVAWLMLFPASVLYRLWAWRDELSRAWRAAKRTARERRGSRAEGAPAPPAGTPTPGPGGGTPPTGPTTGGLRETAVFFREILTATLANILTHRR